jgi:predicted ATPase
MILEINNIGIVKSANISLNGLTLIAGENDTGKSTVGKTIFSIIKSVNVHFQSRKTTKPYPIEKAFDKSNELIFNGDISKQGNIKLKDKKVIYNIDIKDHKTTKFYKTNYAPFFDATIIQSPAIFDMSDFFNSVTKMNLDNRMYGSDFDIKYPYIFWDLYKKLTTLKMSGKSISTISEQTQLMIEGKIKEENEVFSFFKYRHSQEIKYKIENTAFGIKSIGILQVLNDKRYLGDRHILIFDEPEVHLHPKWQLQLAKIIITLVKNKIKVVINSHSPYFIEALRKYGEEQGLLLGQEMNFYLAEKTEGNDLLTEIKDVNSDINLIFQKLSEPMQELVWL